VQAPAVIPAPKVYTKAVAVKTLVVEPRHPAISPIGVFFPFSPPPPPSGEEEEEEGKEARSIKGVASDNVLMARGMG